MLPPLLQERNVAIERITTRINDQIRVSPVRVISEDGQQLGVISTDQALSRAREVGLDLVEVAVFESRQDVMGNYSHFRLLFCKPKSYIQNDLKTALIRCISHIQY
jgi:hypothetical protein